MKAILPIAIFILCLIAVQPILAQQATGNGTAVAVSTKSLSESDKITQLIGCIRNMKGATFIRNGSEHTCEEAASHLQAKWEKHGSKIKSAEDFIEHLASKSSSTGEVYLIRTADGKEKPAGQVLQEALKQLK
ncbi:DUF5329 family protein [Pontibacter sp. H259]|uniref:DUF5329 family protein n=1 Tax=Pontibacter sp. H259 TaxID=3133421 RepID=UPI0030C33C25